MAEHTPTTNDSHEREGERHQSETSYHHLSNQVITPYQALHAWGLQGAQKVEGRQSSEFTPYQAGVTWGLQGAQDDDAAYREEVAAWKARKLQGPQPTPQPLPQLSTHKPPTYRHPPHPYRRIPVR